MRRSIAQFVVQQRFERDLGSVLLCLRSASLERSLDVVPELLKPLRCSEAEKSLVR